MTEVHDSCKYSMNFSKRLHILQASLLLIVCKNIMYKAKVSSIVCITVSEQMIKSTVEAA